MKEYLNRVRHDIGEWNKTRRQLPIMQYSTELLALKALRNEMEIEFAKRLRKIDLQIEEKLKNQ